MEVSAAYPEATDKATVDSTDTNFPKKEARCERRERDFKGGGSEAERWQSATEYHGRFINGFTLAAGGPLPLGFGLSRGRQWTPTRTLHLTVDTDTDHGGGKDYMAPRLIQVVCDHHSFFLSPGCRLSSRSSGPPPPLSMAVLALGALGERDSKRLTLQPRSRANG